MQAMYSYHRVIALLFGIVALLLNAGAWADPPSRVMRLGYTSGSVSLMTAGANDWTQATINLPVIVGDRLWVDAGARAELQLGTAAIRMDGSTSATILNFDDHHAQLQLDQGRVNVRVRSVDTDDAIEINTPNLAFTIRHPGEYRIVVDPVRNSTTVTSLYGQAEAYSEGTTYMVDARKSYRFFGTGLRDYEFLNISPADEFDRWASERDHRWANSNSANYVSRDMIGYEDLDEYGRWSHTENYGNVWIPNQVSLNWAPYYYGRWVWYDPWGWTWVDDAPWGFAVSHYGRWTQLGRRWCWVPGPIVPRPVYAPALVVFVGGRNFQLGFRTGNIGGIGWFPLAPREVYRPSYQVSRQYFTAINTGNTTVNITNVYNNVNVRNITYVNQQVPGAVIAVPETAFLKSQHVSRMAIRVPKEMAANVSVMAGPTVTPTHTRKRDGAEHVRRSWDTETPRTQQSSAPVASEKLQSVPVQASFAAPTSPAVRRGKFEQREKSERHGQPENPRAQSAASIASPVAPSPDQSGRIERLSNLPAAADKPQASAPSTDSAPNIQRGRVERIGKFQAPDDRLRATVLPPTSAPSVRHRQVEQTGPSSIPGDRSPVVASLQNAAPAAPHNHAARREKSEPSPMTERAGPAPKSEAFRQHRKNNEGKQKPWEEGNEFSESNRPGSQSGSIVER